MPVQLRLLLDWNLQCGQVPRAPASLLCGGKASVRGTRLLPACSQITREELGEACLM